jgi:hypothetical protein
MRNKVVPKALLWVALALLVAPTVSAQEIGSDLSSDPSQATTADKGGRKFKVVEAKPGEENEHGVSPDSLGTGSFSTYFTLRNDGFLQIWCGDSRINANSRVFAAVSEYSDIPTHRFVGSANRMEVLNIVPAAGGVTVMVDTHWTAFPINLRLDVLVDP